MRPIVKAIEIAKENHVVYDDYYDSIQECVNSAMQMHEWDKQRFIEWVAEWLDNNVRSYTYDDYNNEAYIRREELIKDLKKAVEEQL